MGKLLKIQFVGFMRFITLNVKKWHKPVEYGWRRESSTIRLLKARSTRIWIEENKHIHALNYWYYRWFTNSYRDFLLYNFVDKGE